MKVVLPFLCLLALASCEPYKAHKRTRRDDSSVYRRASIAPQSYGAPFAFAPLNPMVSAYPLMGHRVQPYGWFPGSGGSNTGGAFQLPSWMPCNCPPDEDDSKGGAAGAEEKEEGEGGGDTPTTAPTTAATTPTTPTTAPTTPTTPTTAATTPTTAATTPAAGAAAAAAPPPAAAAAAPPPPERFDAE
ncbi:predicted protein [Nematostella vectensis]|uniref:Uncharacterized protein n=1 Tax=Nematostella vectensis TaxID=45351 RepID=A7SX87_NEMVE|nr:predicted protein [Nematostella vectensis]|eukprot:XP_001623780.1 predicted protein [Nematostella vectensis]